MTHPYRVIIAGCGAMANTWADYALQRPDTEIVGLVDLYEQTALAFAARHGLTCPTFTDIREAIQATGANIVFDVTIPASHYGIAMTALKEGCHVFGEKPLAESFSDCTDIVQTARSTGHIQAVMQNRRFDPRIRAYQHLISGGAIGQVGYAGADFFLGPHFGGFRDLMDSPLLLDMAIHTFDQARYILEPTRYRCTAMSSTLQVPGIRAMRWRYVYLRCLTGPFSTIAGPGAQRVYPHHGKQAGA